jgi:SAM-dependent methyltransferase/methyltransferase-like protein
MNREGRMSDSIAKSYDELPYTCNAFWYTHPSHLGLMAELAGVPSPSIENCRVLELGCGLGGNILPMALSIPGGEFIGIDLSPHQIDLGKRIAAKAGVTNLDLRAESILDVDARYGEFDFILCHGVYSWTPEFVQTKILEIFRDRLKPGGLAYVSFNSYPGWHARGAIREMYRFHARTAAEPTQKVQRGREFLNFLIEATPEKDGAFRKSLTEERDSFGENPDTYQFHEFHEENNRPLYFREFAAHLQQHGLQYVRETILDAHERGSLDEETLARVAEWSTDRIEREQYLDFITNRTFRRSIVCKSELVVSGQPRTELQQRLRILSKLEPGIASDDAIRSDEPMVFAFLTGDRLKMEHPLMKSALACLRDAQPRSLELDELIARATLRVIGMTPIVTDENRAMCWSGLFPLFEAGWLEFGLHEPPIALSLSEKPVLSPVIRALIASGQSRVTNLRHVMMDADPILKRLAPSVDGTHTVEQLVAELQGAVDRGEVVLPSADPTAEATINQLLSTLLANSALVGH